MTRNFSSVDLPGSVYRAKKRQVIAIVLITNELTYANEANASGGRGGRGITRRAEITRRNFNVITKVRGKVRWNVRLRYGITSFWNKEKRKKERKKKQIGKRAII